MSSASVAVVALGGTIAMTGDPAQGVSPELDATALLESVPGLDAQDVTIAAETLLARPSASLTVDDLRELGAHITRVRAEHTGIVVTQGTDTLEETAFYLDLTIPPGAPVVVTGAMRNPTLAGADGPANLLAAIQVAASESARDLGTLVVFNDEIHAARQVRKTHTTSTGAFTSPDVGPLGRVVEGVARLHRELSPTRTLELTGRQPVNVPVLTSWLGDDGTLFEALAHGEPALDGAVVAALGAGHVSAAFAERVGAFVARTGVPVVLASRTGAGPVVRNTYGFAGSERDLLARGLISAGWLDPYKARLLLHLLLAARADRDRITRTYEQIAG
jgi:L-asparaginase